MRVPDLIKGIRDFSQLSISQTISLVENNKKNGQELLIELFKYTGNAYRIGITGPPGAGKSTITNNLISKYRSENKKVAVIVVDPTSPFSGGAVLGDRVRMTSHYSDPYVFIRSMASRGFKGGLSMKTQEVGEILDAAGFDIIIYETVGVGQIELDVVQATDSVVVTLIPESGDEVQMLKAGLMEIGNIFVINKSDRSGANKLEITLKNILSTVSTEEDVWIPQVVQTVAIEDKGTNNLLNSINLHKKYNYDHKIIKQKLDSRYKDCITDFISNRYIDNFWNKKNQLRLNHELDKKYSERISPIELANKLLNNE